MSYYTKTGNPANNTRGLSTQVRAEFAAIESGFTQAETDIGLKAPMASPAFTGTPTAPTAGAGDTSAKLATTAFVKSAVDAAVINGVQGVVPINSYQLLAPSSLDMATPIFSNTQVFNGQTFLKTGVMDSALTYPDAEVVSYCYNSTTTSPTDNYVYSQVGGNGNQVLFISNSYYLNFYNGTGWSKAASALTATSYSNIVYVAGKWVWVQQISGGRIAGYSTDGSTFTENATALPASMYFRAVASNGTTAVAVGSTSSGTATTTFAYTTDGVTWNTGTMPSGRWQAVVYAAGKFMAFNTDSTVNCYAYSTNGVAWTLGTFPVAYAILNYVVSHGWPNDAAIFAVYAGSSTTYSTTDGINWTLVSGLGTYMDSVSVAKVGDRYFFARQNTKYLLSTTDFVSFRPEFTTTVSVGYYGLFKTGDAQFIGFLSGGTTQYVHAVNTSGYVGSSAALTVTGTGFNPYIGSASSLYYYKRVA